MTASGPFTFTACCSQPSTSAITSSPADERVTYVPGPECYPSSRLFTGCRTVIETNDCNVVELAGGCYRTQIKYILVRSSRAEILNVVLQFSMSCNDRMIRSFTEKAVDGYAERSIVNDPMSVYEQLAC